LIETAAEIFDRDVLVPAGASPGGLARVRALCEAFLSHLERGVFPGGCFFATVAVQLATSPGRPRDRLMDPPARWLARFAGALAEATAGGELPRDADVDQLVFEIPAMLVRANFAWVAFGETHVLEQARVGVGHVLDRVKGHAGLGGGSPERRAMRARRRDRA
jgi:hypothetical protein